MSRPTGDLLNAAPGASAVPMEGGGSGAQPPPPSLEVASSPHLGDSASTASMMRDVLIALAPLMLMSVWLFGWHAVAVVGLCVLGCMGTEALLTWLRGRPLTLGDGSAAITGVILGLSLPWSTPWWIILIGSAAAIGLGKFIFGGLGFNVFNPAMVGRAFIMLSFARWLGAPAYTEAGAALEIMTQATPLTTAKEAADLAAMPSLWPLFLGTHNGSLGETSVLAALIGGAWLLWRRAAAWQIPVAVLASTFVLAAMAGWAGLTPLGPGEHLFGGALVFGAFFIATDPVTSPITPRGRWMFGIGVGLFVVLIRIFSSYPEGVMFAVLIMNAAVPVINRWAVPRPLGWRPPPKETKP